MRFCLYLPAFLTLAAQMVRTRPANDRAAVRGKEFLTKVTAEHILTVAMAADAASAVMALTRFVDTEHHDVSQVPMECMRCASTLSFLFTEGQCVNHGITEHICGLLKVAQVTVFGNSVCSVGGNDAEFQAALARSLIRFKAFTKLALTTMRAEFPVFEHMMGFSVFNLTAPSEALEQVYHSVPPSLPKRASGGEVHQNFVVKRPQAGTACDDCSACGYCSAVVAGWHSLQPFL